MDLVNAVERFPPASLKLAALKPRLREELRTARDSSSPLRYFAIFRANELSREFEVVADCGLQRDIHKRIAEGHLSFNRAWQDLVRGLTTARTIAETGQNPLGQQLKAVFGTHPISESGVLSVKCDDHEYIILLESHYRKGEPFEILNLSDVDAEFLAARIYLAFLKHFREQHVSDWERAVHELASPLDFIYTNSDFLIRYLERPDVDPDFKRKKLEDFKLISDLLIKRLHQFRFAFAGTNHISLNKAHISLYDMFMPITHLWYHEAVRKGLRFVYDELRGFSLWSDPEILQFIVFNLISNAIKYSYRGGEILLYARSIPEDRIAFGVRNHGLEVRPADRARIFDLGYRTDEAQKMDARGMGIGLTVCRQLARYLGGTVSLLNPEEEPGWTVFEVRLPHELKKRKGE